MGDLTLFSRKKWLEPLIMIGGAFLISFLAYLIFSGWIKAPDLNLYQPGATNAEVKSIATQGRAFVNSIDNTWVNVVGFVLLGLVLIGLLVLAILKKLQWRWVMGAVFLAALIIRVIYSNVTDNIFTRQYDVWSNNNVGHFMITMNIYRFGKLPDLIDGSLDLSYQMYHPKYAHYTYAIVMHINSIFFGTKSDSYTLYESIRIFTCAISFIMVYVSYLTFKELFKNKWAILLATLFIGCSPLLIRLSAGSNNDPLLYFFLFLSIYFAIRYFKYNGYGNIIGAALAIGFAMGSKLSGALIAIPIGALFIYKFVLVFIKDKEHFKKNLGTIFLQYGIFLTLCAPIGLMWPIINKVLYDQPLTYVWARLNDKLLVPETYSYAQRYFFINFYTAFENIYHGGWNDRAFLDYNTWSDLMKSAIFGEYTYGDNLAPLAISLYAINYIVLISAFLFWGYLIIYNLIKKRPHKAILYALPAVLLYSLIFIKEGSIGFMLLGGFLMIGVIGGLAFLGIKYRYIEENKVYLFFGLIFMTFMISYFFFQLKYPYTCTHDFRYVGMFIPCLGFVIASLIEKGNKETRIVASTLIVGYILLSSLLYLAIN